ncbi:MAG: carboxypeptidase-like regulatory domain-containing protein [Methanoregula sp.]|jgi:hypothetical protein
MTARPIDPDSRRRPVHAAIAQISVLVLLLVLMVIVPMVSAAENNITSSDNKDIIIKVSNMAEGDFVLMGDIAMPVYSIEILGKIVSQNGIRTLQITNGIDEKKCSVNNDGKNSFSCDLPVYRNTTNFTLTVTDNQGNRAIKNQNFTPYFGLPPPDIIFVHGVVLDSKGNPVPDAVLTFETNTDDNQLVLVNTTTDDEGKYSMEKTFGFHQKITVQKAGYRTLVQEESFEMYGHDINFTLHPQGNPESGLNFFGPVAALVILAMAASLRKDGL